jgi:hypothetical protein
MMSLLMDLEADDDLRALLEVRLPGWPSFERG